MSELIMRLADVMRSEVKGLESIANNASNLATPGYRSQRTNLDGGSFVNKIQSSQPPSTSISLKDGALHVTGQKTDLAIRGQAWFLLDSPKGLLLTRDGRFRLNSEGNLVSRHGFLVQVDGGNSGTLKSDFSANADGTLFSENKLAVRLRLVQAEDVKSITSIGDGLYQYQGGIIPAQGVALVQGAIETSNVDTAADMLHLMRTTRHIETLQRSMSAYDQLLNTGINQIGK